MATFWPPPKESVPTLDGEGEDVGDLLRVTETLTDLVALADTEAATLFEGVTDEPNDTLRVADGEMLAETVVDCVGSTHDVSMTLPAAPAVPDAPPPTVVKPENDAIGANDALKTELPPPPVAGT